MSDVLRRVWEVYERDTQRAIAFASPKQAENQTIFSEVDLSFWSNIYVTPEENTALDNGDFIWCD